MTPEAKITKQITAMLTARPDCWHWKVHGHPMQIAGIPDIAIVFHGLAIYLEVKAPGGRVSPLQEHRMKQIRAAGGIAEVVRSVAEAEAVLKEASGIPLDSETTKL